MVKTGSKPNRLVSEIRAHMPENRHESSTAKGLALLSINVLLYLASLFAILLLPSWPLKIGCALLNGLIIGLLFVPGHDACHGSLTPDKRLNHFLGRLAFLPSLHPYTSWELSHNSMHHGWTNLRSYDYIYSPFSKQEFDHLPIYRQIAERIYRTVWGAGFYYLIEVWWKHIAFPRQRDLQKMDRRAFHLDRILVAGFLIALITLSALAPALFHASGSPLQLVFTAVVLPYLFWNWLMAFITLQHHTHPSVTWFADREEWSFFHGQVRGTVHITFPRIIELMFQNILEHTAHHVDPKIPLYNLRDSQKGLEKAYTEDVIVEKGSLWHFHRVLSKCQLYDYEKRQWLDFQGNPTSDPSILIEEQPTRKVAEHCPA